MLPLSGIKVLDLSRLIPGPFCSRILADLGARITKVEDPVQGDYLRQMGKPLFYALNRGKKIITIDLKSSIGKKKFGELVKKNDVVIESFRPGVMNRLGFSFKELKKINPRVVLASITGFGQTGPLRHKAGHDLNYMSLAGHISSSAMPTMQWADFVGGGLMGALHILAALTKKKRSSVHLDISMTDSMIFCGFSNFFMECPNVLTGLLGRYQIYKTSDGGLVALAALEEKFWKRFCELVGRSEWSAPNFPDASDKIKTELKNLFKTKTRDEWKKLGMMHDICLTPVLSPKEVNHKKIFPL